MSIPTKTKKPKTPIATASKLDAAMGLDIPADPVASVAPPSRIPEQCEYAAELLEEMLTLQNASFTQLQSLLASENRASRSHITDCWNTLAHLLHQQEQLLWRLCDASWYNYGDAFRIVEKKTRNTPDEIRFAEEGNATIIRCPYLPISESHTYTLTEELLLVALSDRRNKRQYSTAHITFLHVYPEVSATIPKDVGSHYYRRVIDLLSVFFGFSDAAQTYSMEMSAAFTDTLPGGTYIIIEERQNHLQKLNFLEKHFSAKS